MEITTQQQGRVNQLVNAFNLDGFDVDAAPGGDVFIYNGKIGIRAVHRQAKIGRTDARKKAYYVEGGPGEMGYLIGVMAEPDISRMCTEFVDNIVFDFLNVKLKDGPLKCMLNRILQNIVAAITKKMIPDIPVEYWQELEGVVNGCRAANPKTKVSAERLRALNAGIDALLAFIYSGKLPVFRKYPVPVRAKYFRVPVMCNGFAAFGGPAGAPDRWHLFGRHFMFPTAGVFQHTAAYILQFPDNGIPFVNVTAPGMIGSIAGMNRFGVGAGVDMAASANCDSSRPGFNSLLLTRRAVEKGNTCEKALDVMVQAQRGVSWIYLLADGGSQRACVVEAGRSSPVEDYLSYPPFDMRRSKVLPDKDFIDAHGSAPYCCGLMPRYNNYRYPDEYLGFDRGCVEYHRKIVPWYKYDYRPDDFGRTGYIDPGWKDKNCPGNFYFAPERETETNLVLATNHFIIPEMRLCAMREWTSIVNGRSVNDSQWRYDELNVELQQAMAAGGGALSYADAKRILNFIGADGKFPAYYNSRGDPLDEVAIHGSQSLMDLVNLTMETRYGYYSDMWLTIHLKRYLAQAG